MTRTGKRTVISSKKRWKPEEDDELRRVAPFVTFRQLAGLLPGRSREAIKRRLTKLGLHAATARVFGSYTLMEVAGILGMEWSAVRWWVDKGYLRHVRVPSLKVQTGRGGRVVIIDADLDAFIAEYPFLFSLASFPEGPHRATLIMARPQDWVNRQQAARMLGMCPAHLTDLERSGKLPSRRFGKQIIYFRRREIERYKHERSRRILTDPAYANRWAHRYQWTHSKKAAS